MVLSPPPALSTKFAPLLSHSSHSIRCVDQLFQVTTGIGGPTPSPAQVSCPQCGQEKGHHRALLEVGEVAGGAGEGLVFLGRMAMCSHPLLRLF
jgi:hypothetical protein